jgi:hypothetical protein
MSETAVIGGGKLFLTSEDHLMQVQHTRAENDVTFKFFLDREPDAQQKSAMTPIIFKFAKKPVKVFFRKIGSSCLFLVRSGSEIKRSIVLNGKNRIIPGDLKLEL